MKYRTEKDALGPVKVPVDALYGAQTQRASENFRISSIRLQNDFIRALAIIKKHAAVVNAELGLIEKKVSGLIIAAANEVIEGKHNDQFIVDVFQTGSGTSTNMNMNEVIAGRSNEIHSGRRGSKQPVHPNDHVNLCQSSNDVIPSAINISVLSQLENMLLPALEKLKSSLSEKAGEFADVQKLGRTHLQDAVVMTMGQEFSGYAYQLEKDIARLEEARKYLYELSLGGTAVGTGINAHPEFAGKVIKNIAAETGLDFRETKNHFASQASQDDSLALSGVLKTIAVNMAKIANDIRWLSSGPRAGLGEIRLPALQPGSSIMPGKVNPVIPEAVLQVSAHVTGNDAAVTAAAGGGNFELNTMLPVIAYNLIQSVEILSGAATAFAEKCVDGIVVNRERCRLNVENSLDIAVKLIPYIGYDRASEISKQAYEQNLTVRQVVEERQILSKEQMDEVF
ncbi:MAG: class II fumarate hydratase [Bacteroidales bacterium]|jgi:fumarate hydratase class II|nr:class II fumarate hydratase [Bacteroidales bacterium]